MAEFIPLREALDHILYNQDCFDPDDRQGAVDNIIAMLLERWQAGELRRQIDRERQEVEDALGRALDSE